jgi:uncharacterized protein (DUF2235 family)
MKRLVILADGTWMTVRNETNVVRLSAAVPRRAADGIVQHVAYHPGVGAGPGVGHLLGGAFGTGLSRDVMDCYRSLVELYEEGDELFFFGYSRGAYTVRSLGGLVNNLSILHKGNAGLIPEAYEHYRDPSPSWRPHGARAVDFADRNCWPMPRITCIGVWDTVGSLGIPTDGPLGRFTRRLHEFHDVRLAGIVQNAFQALAIDEHRGPFTPAVWSGADAHRAAGQRLEQLWFPGSHTNVGGGFADTRLSDGALAWMAERAGSCGLEVDAAALRVAGARYDGPICDAYSPFFRVMDRLGGHGRIDRCIGQAPTRGEDGDLYRSDEGVHRSALDRLDGPLDPPPYAPANLLAYLRSGAVRAGDVDRAGGSA